MRSYLETMRLTVDAKQRPDSLKWRWSLIKDAVCRFVCIKRHHCHILRAMKCNSTVWILALLLAGCGGSSDNKKGEANKGGQKSTTASGGIVDGATLITEGEIAMQNLEGALSPFSGTAVYYYETGQKSEQVNYANGLMEGKLEGWYEDGKKFLEGTKKQGKWDGEYKEWYDNGHKKVEAIYKEGNFEGQMIWYYSDTEKPMKVVNYVNGKKEGTATGFYETGNKQWETTWKDGLKDGEHKEYFGDESLKSSIPYVAGKRQGAGKVWYPASPATNNERVLAKEMTFGDDKLNGVYKTFYPHGGPMQIATFKDGKMDGEAKKYHENGREAEIATFTDGNNKPVSFQAFDENGNPTKSMGPTPVATLPKGRTMIWESPQKLQFYINKSFTVVKEAFGKPDTAKKPYIYYNNIKIKNPKAPQAQAVPVQLIFQLDEQNKVVNYSLKKNQSPIQ